jgi:UDP-GlcNAc:undecaprenyl-phosphate/decaprenyl-phosphate GlcNAc-1-phosphate transferase
MTAVWASGVGAFLLALVLAQLCKPLARRVDLVARPKADRWHREVVPLLGGVAIAGAVLATAVALPIHSHQLLVLLFGAGALFVVGLLDDFRPFKPQTKFICQILAAAVMAAFGLQLHLTGVVALDVLLTLFWLVGITNAFNLLDNMDGLSAGIAAITAGFRLVFFLNDGDMEAAQIAAAVVGACVGFLFHNFNPASIFMGDAGSLFLGFLVAGLSLAGSWPYSRSTVSVLLFPVLILLVPIFDTTFVTIARTLAGRPVSRGGRDHTSHRLVASGLSERRAVITLYSVALLCGGLAFYAYTTGLSSTIVFVVFLAIGLVLFGLYLARVQVYPESETSAIPDGGLVHLIDVLPFKRQVASVVIDSLLMVAAYYSAYRLRFEQSYAQHEPWFASSVTIVLACQLVAFATFRVYQGVWRYTSVPDLIRLIKGSAAGTALAVLVIVLLYRFEGFSRSVFVLDAVLLLLFVAGSRLSLRMFGELLRGRPQGVQRVMIYGAGDGGVLALRELRNNADWERSVVGFLDDDRWKHRTSIHGVPVLGGTDRLEELLDRHPIDEIIVTSTKITPERLAALTAACEARDVRIVRAWLKLDKLVAS